MPASLVSVDQPADQAVSYMGASVACPCPWTSVLPVCLRSSAETLHPEMASSLMQETVDVERALPAFTSLDLQRTSYRYSKDIQPRSLEQKCIPSKERKGVKVLTSVQARHLRVEGSCYISVLHIHMRLQSLFGMYLEGRRSCCILEAVATPFAGT